MRDKLNRSNNVIVFSKWSGKSYAIFASLKKVVNIVRLSVDMCISSFTKNQFIIRLFNQASETNTSENEFDENRIVFSNWFIVMLLELGIINIDDSYNSKFYIRTTKSPFSTQCRKRTFFIYAKNLN